MTKTLIYLHGFASSPGSTKAQIFAEKLKGLAIDYQVPDLNVPDFTHLTLSAMIARTAETVQQATGPVILIGSSMGGLTATHFMDRHADDAAKQVAHVVMLAPAFDFMENRDQDLGSEGLAQWRETGWLETYHYAPQTQGRIHYGLVENIQQYDSYDVRFSTPVTIFHGKNDTSVNYQQSERFAADRPNVTLHLLNSDHSLLDQIDFIWDHIRRICGL